MKARKFQSNPRFSEFSIFVRRSGSMRGEILCSTLYKCRSDKPQENQTPIFLLSFQQNHKKNLTTNFMLVNVFVYVEQISLFLSAVSFLKAKHRLFPQEKTCVQFKLGLLILNSSRQISDILWCKFQKVFFVISFNFCAISFTICMSGI